MKPQLRERTQALIFASLFTALMAVFAQIQIPTPFFPITLQAFAIALCGYTLDTKYSLFSVLTYMLLGIVGAPVFSGFCGGFHHITEPAGGFVIGFIPLVIFCSLSAKLKTLIQKIGIGLLGVVIMYALGLLHFRLVTGVSFLGAVIIMFSVTFVKDILFCTLAFYISKYVKTVIKK